MDHQHHIRNKVLGHTCKVTVLQEFFFSKKHIKESQQWMIIHLLASLLFIFFNCLSLTAKFTYVTRTKICRLFTKTQQICLFTAFCEIKKEIFLFDLIIRDHWLFSHLHEFWRCSIVKEECGFNTWCFICILVHYNRDWAPQASVQTKDQNDYLESVTNQWYAFRWRFTLLHSTLYISIYNILAYTCIVFKHHAFVEKAASLYNLHKRQHFL